MGDYTTVERVRTCSGIKSDKISTDDMEILIIDAEREVDQLMHTTYEPKIIIERLESILGVSPHKFFVKKYPILRIIKFKITDTEVSPKHLKTSAGGGVEIMNTSEKSYLSNELQDNIIKYSFADLETSRISTETTSAVTEADDINIAVLDSTIFTIGDYVKIEGMDGYSEVALISAKVDETHITVSISQPHENESIVTKMEIPKIIIRLTDLIASLMGIARLIGASYDEIVGYDIDGLHVQKGEPYTQFRESAKQFKDELKDIIKTKRPKAAIA